MLLGKSKSIQPTIQPMDLGQLNVSAPAENTTAWWSDATKKISVESLTQREVAASQQPLSLGEYLCEQGWLRRDHLRVALQEQQLTGERLGLVLCKMAMISTEQCYQALATLSGRALVNLDEITLALPIKEMFTAPGLRENLAFPLPTLSTAQHFCCAAADPDDLMMADNLRRILAAHGIDASLQFRLADPVSICRAIDRNYGVHYDVDAEIKQLENQCARGISPTVSTVLDAIFSEALQQQASDVHFSPEEKYIRVRYRQDGLLHDSHVVHKVAWPHILSRLKIMSGMNIAENRLPQDGKSLFHLPNSSESVECRLSSLPTHYGENVVIRLLDRRAQVLTLHNLAVEPEDKIQLAEMLQACAGLILITGPTGCGKTTTLYALLAELNQPDVNILTLEDPVEYRIAGIRQTSLAETKLNFAQGIRAMLRQDPDILLIGEIRDQETAQMALRAAMLGRKVLATLHCNSALAALPRLHDLGVSKEQLAGNLIGIVAQRLLRQLCPHCKEPLPAAAPEQLDVNDLHSETIHSTDNANIQITQQYQAVGCPQCQHSGYRGRFPIVEIIRIAGKWDELIADGAHLPSLQAASDSRSLYQAGLSSVMAGRTSLTELHRVVTPPMSQLPHLPQMTTSPTMPPRPTVATKSTMAMLAAMAIMPTQPSISTAAVGSAN